MAEPKFHERFPAVKRVNADDNKTHICLAPYEWKIALSSGKIAAKGNFMPQIHIMALIDINL